MEDKEEHSTKERMKILESLDRILNSGSNCDLDTEERVCVHKEVRPPDWTKHQPTLVKKFCNKGVQILLPSACFHKIIP